ncbi:S8 family serine peptidase [Leucobacter sp. USHLN153]|uniref:S8 family serine peptidase n=1 Tax=Leucobacter sp. USHLN153 TaxID=3081268 RepID=UPI003015C24D
MKQRGLRVAALALAACCGVAAFSAALVSETPTPAFAAERCAPGVMARLPGPPEAFAAMGWFPESGADLPTGSGVTVAVIDSGIDASRPQLEDAFTPGSDSLIADGERTDGLGDPQGHGTAIAGIIAARPSATAGAVGIAPDARLISLRVFRGTDEESVRGGFGPEPERVAAAIRRGADLGAQIISVSLSDDADVASMRAATAYAASRGSLVVASAGTRGSESDAGDAPRYPAAYPGVLSVTAVDADGLPTDDAIHGAHVGVAAPGQNVLSLSTGGGDCLYGETPEASFATAYAAGAAALLAERYPEEGPAGWAYRLQATAARSDPDSRDDLLGWGVIRPTEALDLRPSAATRGPASPFADTSDAAVPIRETSVTTHATEPGNQTLVVSIAAVAAGLVALFALGARLRRK